jgi:hypothetical protein
MEFGDRPATRNDFKDFFEAFLKERFDAMDQRFDAMDGRLEELSLEVGAVKTRLGDVESAVNRIASRVGVGSIPALGGSGKPAEPLDAKQREAAEQRRIEQPKGPQSHPGGRPTFP